MLQSLPRKVCDVENDFAATTLLPQTQVLFNYLLSHLKYIGTVEVGNIGNGG